VSKRLFAMGMSIVVLALALGACGGGGDDTRDKGDEAAEDAEFTVTSTSFAEGGSIPSTYTCEGDDLSPPLTWSGVPEDAYSLVLIVDDPDAPDPDAPKTTWVHWVLYNISADTTGLPEAVEPQELPSGTVEGLNDWQRTGYGGPCPPKGRHRYLFKLYALDTVLTGLDEPTKAEVEAAMEGHVVGQAELVGTYEKTGRHRSRSR
jgi:Raf kinase inhibitor-like YbhB/YbcL family protein